MSEARPGIIEDGALIESKLDRLCEALGEVLGRLDAQDRRLEAVEVRTGLRDAPKVEAPPVDRTLELTGRTPFAERMMDRIVAGTRLAAPMDEKLVRDIAGDTVGRRYG
jgi:hypothetical protein